MIYYSPTTTIKQSFQNYFIYRKKYTDMARPTIKFATKEDNPVRDRTYLKVDEIKKQGANWTVVIQNDRKYDIPNNNITAIERR